MPFQGQVLEIPAQREARPSLDQCRQFVAQCLDQDCPVAFLNFSHGALKNLDSWHWVPLTAMTEGESVLLCTILDEGEARVIDLALWWETSSLGAGALVGLFPDMESDQTDSAEGRPSPSIPLTRPLFKTHPATGSDHGMHSKLFRPPAPRKRRRVQAAPFPRFVLPRMGREEP